MFTAVSLLLSANGLPALGENNVVDNSAPILDRIQHLQALAHPELEGGTMSLTWSDCSGGKAHAKTTSLEPTTMRMGQTTTIVGKGTLDEEVTGGTYEIDVNASMLRKKFTGNLCEPKKFRISVMGINAGEMGWDGMDCPVKPGANVVKMTSMLSASLPRNMARSTIRATAKDQNGNELMCIEVHMK